MRARQLAAAAYQVALAPHRFARAVLGELVEAVLDLVELVEDLAAAVRRARR